MGSKSKAKKAGSAQSGKDAGEDDALLQRIRDDDAFFAKQLDLVPRRFLIPLTDEQKDELHEKQLRARTGGGNKGKKRNTDEAFDDEEEGERGSKRKRDFNNAISNAEAIEEAARKQEEQEKEIAKHYLKTEKLVPSKAKKTDDVSLAELRARLQSKIDAEKKKGGVPGARAERDKLLPPRPPRRQENRKDDQEDSTSNGGRSEETASVKSSEKSVGDSSEIPPKTKKKSTKEELEAKISFGVLKIDDDAHKKIGDKPARSKTSTRSIINVKKLIKEAEKSQARMEALKAQGKEDVVQQERWDTLEKKAAGEKVRDDPKLLKKALKRLEKKKVHSAQEWQERKKQQEEDKKDRTDQRSKNIEERKMKKIEKRGGVVQKKEEAKEKRRRPGFEGANAPWKKGKDQQQGGSDKKRKPEGGKTPKSPFSKKQKTEQ